MKREISPGVIIAAIAGAILLMGIFFFVSSRNSGADVKATAERGQASGSQMMQYMQDRPRGRPGSPGGPNGGAPSGFDPQNFRPGTNK